MNTALYPPISVNQFQFRKALLDQGLYDQVTSNFMNSADGDAKLYMEWAPMLSSANACFREEWTTLTDAQMYAAFQLAQTVPAE